MAGNDMQNAILIALVVVVALFIAYQYNPHLFVSLGLSQEGFADAPKKKEEKKEEKKDEKKKEEPKKDDKPKKAGFENEHFEDKKKAAFQNEGFADLTAYDGPAQFGSAEAPAGCYPRDQLTPSELLPKDMTSVWAEQNPMGAGSLKGKSFLSAGSLIGVNTVGQSMRNANLQIRSEPPNPQQAVSIFNQSTISPDVSHRPLEIGA
jgi:Sec-independent protein translocase protein TatA